MGLYDNLHVLVERHEEAQKAFHGKLPEFTAQHLRYIGLADSEQAGGLDLFQAAFFHDRVYLKYKLRLDQMLFRIRHIDILEHIAAADFISLLAAHGFTSFAICSALLSRCLTACARCRELPSGRGCSGRPPPIRRAWPVRWQPNPPLTALRSGPAPLRPIAGGGGRRPAG